MTLVHVPRPPRRPATAPLGWLRRRRAEREWQWYVEELARAWAAAVDVIGLVEQTSSGAGIPHTNRPEVRSVEPGPPLTLVVRMLPGQLPGDFAAAARRLAEGLGVAQVRVTGYRTGWIRVVLLARDPLGTPMPLPAGAGCASVLDPVLLGADEAGQPVTLGLSRRLHLAVQGVTGAGKSRFLYSLLTQLAPAADAIIAGSDPSRVLLRPFQHSRHAPWQVLGLGDLAAHVRLVQHLVALMDQRLARIPPRLDELPITGTDPMIVLVLEEFPALLTAAAQGKERGKPTAADLITAAVQRLICEGGKVGFRLIVIAQRFEANLVGGLIRAECAARISFPVDNADSVKLLHPAATGDLVEAHLEAEPGLALPGRRLTRIRAPWIGDYATYCDSIRTTFTVPAPPEES